MVNLNAKLLLLSVIANMYITTANATGYTGRRYNVPVVPAYRTTGPLLGGGGNILPTQVVPNAAQPTFVYEADIQLERENVIRDAPQEETVNFVLKPQNLIKIAESYEDSNINYVAQVDPYDFQNRTNDLLMKERSYQDQGLLYLASVQNMIRQDPDTNVKELIAESELKEQEMKQMPIYLYDELRQIATDTTNSRITSFITSNINTSYGIASGDGYISEWSRGIWVRGLYGNIHQGQSHRQVGLSGKTSGEAVGIDLNLSDNAMIGLSYTHMHADFKYKYGQGNKVDTTSDIVSLYGVRDLSNNFILHGLFSVGHIKANRQTQHLIALNTHKTATGKFKVSTYSGEGVLNYKVPMNDSTYYLIPNVGVRFSKNYAGGYNEFGTGIYNLSVSSKHNTTLALIAGIKMGRSYQASDNLDIMPGLHFEIDHHVFNKASQVKTKMQWADTSLNSAGAKISAFKTGYNLGATLFTKYKMIEMLPTYNLHLRGKYISNQFSLKLKILL